MTVHASPDAARHLQISVDMSGVEKLIGELLSIAANLESVRDPRIDLINEALDLFKTGQAVTLIKSQSMGKTDAPLAFRAKPSDALEAVLLKLRAA